MISKELLSYVLGQCCKIPESVEYNNLIYFCELQWEKRSINIYELAHKCKEWAASRNIRLNSSLDHCDVWSSEFDECAHTSFAASEPEAIFKACQWILENK
jgi:hypothetical protein